MTNPMNDYGWTNRSLEQRKSVAEQYGWTQPFSPTHSEITCSECGRPFKGLPTAGVCYCERCVNYVQD